MATIKNKKKLEDYKITPAEISVVFKDNLDKPVHRWFHYAEGFSSEFVQYYLDKYEIDSNKVVYDPFMGSGTVGVCSKLKNINSYGVELNPLMYFISNVKTNIEQFSIDKIIELKNNLTFPDSPKLKPPSFLNNEKHFNPEILKEVLKIKESVFNLPDTPEKDIFKLAFANILLRSSNAKRVPSFGYKNKKNLNVHLPMKLFYNSLESIIEDLKLIKNSSLGKVHIIKGDSRFRYLPENSIDIAITSPPYANGIDYVTDYQLEMGWLELINESDKSKLRDDMIAYDKTRSKILKDFYLRNQYYKEENLLDVIGKLEKISNDYWKKDIHLVVLKYFDDMYRVLKNTYYALKKDSRFILVIGDSLFKNVYVPTDLLIGIMGEKIGFEFESIQLARIRYSGQNRSFQLRETIVTLKK